MKSLSPNKLASASGGGAVQSVNTQTGAVSLGVEDLDDFALNLNTSTPIYSSVRQNDGQNATNDGEYTQYVTSNTRRLLLNWDQADGSRSVQPTGTIWLSADGVTFSALAIDGNVSQAIWTSTNRSYEVNFDVTNWAIYTGLNIAIGGTLYWASSDPSGVPVALADGDLLRYESVSSKFRPAQLSVDNLSDVDTSTVAPTDGQALVWDNANSQWEPGTVSAPVSSVNTLTGAVSLGVEDLDDVQYNVTTTATVYEFTFAGTSGGAGTGEAKTILNPNTNPPSTDKLRLSTTDANGTSVPSFSSGSTVWLSADEVTYSTVTPTSFGISGSNWILSLDSTDEDTYDALGIAVGGTLYVSATDPNPQTVNPSNGEILQYDTATSKFKPAQLAGGMSRAQATAVALVFN